MLAKTAADLSWADEMPLRRAAVIYDSLFGKTERVAQAIARGIRKENVPTDVLSVSEAEQKPVDGYDLLVLGSPSRHLLASEEMV
ncbi:MAG TPA: flavodoxin domain-containing protein, partial [Thermoplasmata archaeon]|nr:flavodoxin domain-containing protein [Thermoplasmata archaeon]